MSQFKKRFETKASTVEMKHYIDTKLLTNPTLKPLLDTVVWRGDVLFITSKLGKGTLTLIDNYVDIEIELSFFGSIARNTLETTLDSEFKKIHK